MTRKSRSVERDFLFQTIMEQIAIQGIAGCYHETAARGYFADREIEVLPCLSFDELFARMAADPALLGIAAIENTIAGSLLPNHELLQQSRARIIGEQKLRISHVLAALPGQTPDDIAEVRSHPIALMQCGDFLKTLPGMKIVERDDTAGSAREIAEGRLAGTAAICGADAARLYGLEILRRGIETNKHNFTRFLLLGDAKKDRMNEQLDKTPETLELIKLPHHGDSNKPLLKLIGQTRPCYAVATVSPAEEVEDKLLAALAAAGTQVFRTDGGAVSVEWTNGGFTVMQQTPQDF